MNEPRPLSAEQVIEQISSRFSEPSPLNQALIDRHEWRALLERFREVANEGHVAATSAACARCRLSGTIADALGRLT